MFRVSYIKGNEVLHKGSFKTVTEAMKWIENQADIIPLKLLVFNDYIDCYSKVCDL